MKREIEITIDPDGTTHIEAFGFEGQGCHESVEKLAKRLGKQIASKKKSEYYLQKEKAYQKIKERA